MLEWQQESADPREFMEGLKIDLYQGRVFVFTPKGDVVDLPAGSTPIDFAYAIHTEVGHRCVGARVAGRLVPLDYQLQTGATVEVLASKAPDAAPSRGGRAVRSRPSWSRADAACGSLWPGAALPCPATTSWDSSLAARASRFTGSIVRT